MPVNVQKKACHKREGVIMTGGTARLRGKRGAHSLERKKGKQREIGGAQGL